MTSKTRLILLMLVVGALPSAALGQSAVPAPATPVQTAPRPIPAAPAAMTLPADGTFTSPVPLGITGYVRPAALDQTASTRTIVSGVADAEYRNGLALIQARRYDEAIRLFDRVVERKDDKSGDAALYWKAFSEYRIGQSDQALASIAALRRDHPSSRYLADAKVLEADVRRLAGRPVSPDAATDDEIKLLAIQGLSKSSEAIPLLEGVLAASNSLNVKKRALYVLALSEDARANDILMRYARGAGNPDLQIEAIRYLGARRVATTGADLREIYGSTTDARIKVAIIDLLRTGGDKQMLLQLYAQRNASPTVRTAIVSRLGSLVTADDVLALYRQETDPALKVELLSVLGLKLGVYELTQIARGDANATVRSRAVRILAGQRTDASTEALVGLYTSESAADVKRAVIDALAAQKNAEALVTLARKETDVELKRNMVRQLSALAPQSKVAADYLMEQLK